MVKFVQNVARRPAVLATDLDGTLIPLDQDPQQRRDLQILADLLHAETVDLVFVTGRHFASVESAFLEFGLPQPEWVLCDVGTSIYARQGDSNYELLTAYAQHLAGLVGEKDVDWMGALLQRVSGLRMQESEKQGPYKLSFYCNAAAMGEKVRQIEMVAEANDAPYSVVGSIDPFTHDGLIDLLPRGVSKAYALKFWAEQQKVDPGAILFAGDSGNDLAALTAGYRAILVRNAAADVVESVQQALSDKGQEDSFFHATEPATSGVLQGVRNYLSPFSDSPKA